MTALEHLMEQEKADKRFWLTEEEAQDFTKRCRGTLWKLRKQGILDFRKDNRETRYIKASVYAYVRERVQKEPVMVVAVKVTRPKSKSRWGR
jgi:hypothetical protein